MGQFKDTFYKNQSTLYKLILFILATVTIVYFFPKRGKFKYEFSKGKPWQYENLYAPFDFAVLKSDDLLLQEQQKIKDNNIPYFNFNTNIQKEVKDKIKANFEASFSAINETVLKDGIYNFINDVVATVYKHGVLEQPFDFNNDKLIYLEKSNQVTETTFGKFYSSTKLTNYITSKVKANFPSKEDELIFFFFENIKPNVTFDKNLTNKAINEELSKVLNTRGSVEKDRRIIAKGEIIDSDTFQILKSLENQFEKQIWSDNNQNWIIFGYTILVALALLMLFLFIKKYRYDIYQNNTKVTFVVFNMLLMVVITTCLLYTSPSPRD